MTGSAGRHAGSVRHRVIVDVLGPDATSFQQNSTTGANLQHQPQEFWVFLGVERAGGPSGWTVSHLLARRMLTCGVVDSGSGTQSGWIRLKSSASSWSSLKQHTPTEGPTTTTMLLTWQPNSVTMVVTVAIATPSRVPFQPEEELLKSAPVFGVLVSF